MALYRVTINKAMPDRPLEPEWSNVYYADADDVDQALDVGEAIQLAEAAVTKDYVTFTTIHAVQPFSSAAAGKSRLIGAVGAVAGDITLMLPLFNAVRVVLQDNDHRPSQKYLRLPLEEGDIASGVLTTAVRDAVDGDYVGALLPIIGLVSNTGSAFTEGVTQPDVQMRQRGWHRRTRPGFHRGWVPD